jgi:hypothetical protein
VDPRWGLPPGFKLGFDLEAFDQIDTSDGEEDEG